MIYAVTAENWRGEQLEMRLSCPQFSGLNIYNIDGLGTPKADIKTAETALLDGTLYSSSIARERNIVIYAKFVDSLFEGSPGCMYPESIRGVCTDSYLDLDDKPSINDVIVVGDLTSEDLGLQNEMEPIANTAIERMITQHWGNTYPKREEGT